MAGHGHHRAAMSALGKESQIEPAYVRVAMGFAAHSAVSGFDKGPFQILIDET